MDGYVEVLGLVGSIREISPGQHSVQQDFRGAVWTSRGRPTDISRMSHGYLTDVRYSSRILGQYKSTRAVLGFISSSLALSLHNMTGHCPSTDAHPNPEPYPGLPTPPAQARVRTVATIPVTLDPAYPAGAIAVLVYHLIPTSAVNSRFYGVRVGHQPGIYLEWSDCNAATSGYPGNCQKKFGTMAQACAFVWGLGWRRMGPYLVVIGGEGGNHLPLSRLCSPDWFPGAEPLPAVTGDGIFNVDQPLLRAQFTAAEESALAAAAMETPPNVAPYAKRSEEQFPGDVSAPAPDTAAPATSAPAPASAHATSAPPEPVPAPATSAPAPDTVPAASEASFLTSLSNLSMSSATPTLIAPLGLDIIDDVSSLPEKVIYALRKMKYSPNSIRVIAAVYRLVPEEPVVFKDMLVTSGMDEAEAIELWSDLRMCEH